MDIQRKCTTHSPSNGGLPVVMPRDLPYDAYGKSRYQGSGENNRRIQEGLDIHT